MEILAEQVFMRLEAIYLQDWSRQFTSVTIYDQSISNWVQVLSKLTDAQIDNGIDRCRTEQKWPPNTARFYELATNKDKVTLNAAMYRERSKNALPILKSTPEFAAKWRAKWKQMLGKG